MSEPAESAASPFSRPVTKSVPNVFVTGDLVWDTHIAKLLAAVRGYHQSHLNTQLTNRYGGAWHFENMIGLALRSTGIESSISAPTRASHEAIENNSGPGGIAKAFSVWDWFPGKPHGGAWRIQEFLGCEAADWSRTPCQTLDAAPVPPSLLAIDDLGLGFADNPDAWPACLAGEPSAGPRIIVAKSAPPFDRPLWKKLLQPAWAERLTVVIAAAALRDAGAKLSTGSSWDLTIEESQRVFSNGGVAWPLRFCKRVIIVFGRSGAAVFSRSPQSPTELAEPPSEAKFERFVFDPAHLEDTWSADLPGTTFGTASSVAALQVAHELLPLAPSSHLTVSRGLAAARCLHLLGAGTATHKISPDHAEQSCFSHFPYPENDFRSAFARRLLDPPVLVTRAKLPDPSILTDCLGVTEQFLTVAAEQIVRFGKESVLHPIPHLGCGNFFTVDREEIERLNSVRNIILEYRRSSIDSRPLSLAVFGAPGSGKSFAIKQLADSLFGADIAVLEFNLSQFESLEDLHGAFHEVRDKSVHGKIPFVFWDEFDCPRGTRPLGWLKDFLAPMQDAQFVAKGKPHPFGKCIFVFAGGTSSNFADFETSAKDKEAKGPDFVSRLRGFVNIKGPNPEAESGDEVFVIRRALLLRALISRYHPGLIQPETGRLSIAPNVLSAFLRVPRYFHGARSMESLVSLSRLRGSRHFGPSELPPSEVAQLHVSPEFSLFASSQDGVTIGPAEIEQLAAIMHNNWVKAKIKDGWSKGDSEGRNPTAKTDSRLVDYHDLANDADKEPNRQPARLTVLRLEALNYQIIRRDLQWGEHQIDLAEETDTLEQFARSEHRRWMRAKLLAGACFSEHTSDELQLHEDIRPFELLPLARRNLDFAIAKAVMDFLTAKGLTLVRGKSS